MCQRSPSGQENASTRCADSRPTDCRSVRRAATRQCRWPPFVAREILLGARRGDAAVGKGCGYLRKCSTRPEYCRFAWSSPFLADGPLHPHGGPSHGAVNGSTVVSITLRFCAPERCLALRASSEHVPPSSPRIKR